MILKGGILLALGYESTRFTKDIDFSTATKTKDFDVDQYVAQFESALFDAVEKLDYGLDYPMNNGADQGSAKLTSVNTRPRMRVEGG